MHPNVCLKKFINFIIILRLFWWLHFLIWNVSVGYLWVSDVFIKQHSLDWNRVDVQLFELCLLFFENLYNSGLMKTNVSLCGDIFFSYFAQ